MVGVVGFGRKGKERFEVGMMGWVLCRGAGGGYGFIT